MKIFTKTKENKNNKKIRKYKIFGITVLKRETSPHRKRWYIGSIKIASFKYSKKHLSIETNNYIKLNIFQKQRNEFSGTDYTRKISELKNKPTFSIIMPVYNADPHWLKVAVESVQNQYYTNWQLIAVDDGSVDRRACAILKDLSSKDNRIIFYESKKNRGISAASNTGLSLSKNKYFLLMDQDDEITPDALYWFADALEKHPDADVIYSDECKINLNGDLFDFYFKPDWSPALLLNHMYTGHLSLYRHDIVEKVGGFRSKYDFSQDYDLILRVSDQTNKIYHIERVLYFWRTLSSSGAAGGKDWARTTNIKALTDWYNRQGLKYTFSNKKYSNYGKVIRKNNPLVSIVIPSDSLKNLTDCINGILSNTSYANIEIVPVTNSKTANDLIDIFGYLNNLNICHYNKIFNFSDKCNDGAKQANGEYVIFYNDDVFPETSDWIDRLLDIIVLKNVGGVSPLLKYENGTIQYAGMMTNVPGLIGTSFHCYNANTTDINYGVFHHNLIRNVSILSGACFLMKRDLFFELGGFDAINTPNGHSDVDISFKILDAGLYNVCTPAARMIHIGNHTWHAKNTVDKADIYVLKRWGKYMAHESYYTQTMKHALYKDFEFDCVVYTPDNIFIPQQKDSKDVLLISHELTRTGAPGVLYEAAKILKKNNFFPVVLSPVDGPLRQEFLDAGITVIIDPGFQHKHWLFERFARNFDLVIANTLATGYAVELLNNSLPPVIWWLHEGSVALNVLKDLIPEKFGKNISVYCVSEYSKNTLKNNINNDLNKLPFGIADFSATKKAHDKINFITVGTIEPRKGQDLLLKAIKKLPEKYKNKSSFTIVGTHHDKNIIQQWQEYKTCCNDINIFDSMNHDDLLSLYNNMDCIITPSRDEPMSITTIEMLIQSKLCIISDACGISHFLTDGKDGFVFESENVDALVDKIKYIIDHYNDMDNIRKNARKVYENNFTTEIFEKNLLAIINKVSPI